MFEKDHELTVKITYDDYKKMWKIFPTKFLKLFLIPSVLWMLFSLVALIPDEEIEPTTLPELILMDAIIILFWLMISWIIISIFRKKDYKEMLRDNTNYTLIFYEDHIIKQSENIHQKILYTDIKKYKEKDFILYLMLDKNNIIPISELALKEELIYHIKHSLDHSVHKNQNISEYTSSQRKGYRILNVMKIILIILFILTLLTPWLALAGWAILVKINHAADFNVFKYTYGALFALPLPILSLVLGIIFNRKGLKCIKNIVSGIIMILIIIMISLSSLTSLAFNKNYSEVNAYTQIIGIELPKEGEYSSVKWDSSYLQNHISNRAKFTNTEEANKFYQKIQTNDHWITKENISTALNIFIPQSLICTSKEKECYYSIYNQELKEYNTIPTESGNYHIKTMLYDPNIHTLKIEEYTYEYKN